MCVCVTCVKMCVCLSLCIVRLINHHLCVLLVYECHARTQRRSLFHSWSLCHYSVCSVFTCVCVSFAFTDVCLVDVCVGMCALRMFHLTIITASSRSRKGPHSTSHTAVWHIFLFAQSLTSQRSIDFLNFNDHRKRSIF